MVPTPPEPPAPAREPDPGALGLRLRLWLAGLASGAVAGVGTLWVLGTRIPVRGAADPAELLAWLSGVAFLSLLTGAGLSLWLDHHVVGHLRGVLRGLHGGRVSDLRGLPAASGWGELSELTERTQELLASRRSQARAVEELQVLRGQLALLAEAVARWDREEHWGGPLPEAGEAAPLAESLAHGIGRRHQVGEQNREAARQVAAELERALTEAGESATQAERGFVEATALLTTVRELQRLSGELQNALHALAAAPVEVREEGHGAREALEELVSASQGSIESLGRGLLRAQEVSDAVQTLANRSTLIAIQVLTAGARAPAGEDPGADLRTLAQEVREVTDRTAQYAADIEAAVVEAGERMRAARADALARLDGAGAASRPASLAPRALDDAHRLLERVREMLQDASAKGERLSAAGERSSRAAERLARRLEGGAAEAEALCVRLAPVGEAPGPGPDAQSLRLLAVEPEVVDLAAERERGHEGERP
jgi:hypothetical protein